MNGNIVWLASYPKSGNTWFRTFVSNLLSGAEQPVHINRIVGAHSNLRRTFDWQTGIDSSNLFPDEADMLRPAWYRRISRETKPLCWMKTHDAYRCLPDDQPLFPSEATRCTIYLVRNPLDVAPSFARHMGMEQDEIINLLNDGNGAINTERNDVTPQLAQCLLSWSGHVQSWLEAPAAMKVHVIRYEDMKHSPLPTFMAAVRAIGLDKTEADIQRALGFSSFSVLQEMEQRDGFRERPAHSGAFFREGKAGAGRGILTPVQAGRIMAAHAETMRRFGYLDEPGGTA